MLWCGPFLRYSSCSTVSDLTDRGRDFSAHLQPTDVSGDVPLRDMIY